MTAVGATFSPKNYISYQQANLIILGNYYIMLFPIKINVFSFPIGSGIK